MQKKYIIALGSIVATLAMLVIFAPVQPVDATSSLYECYKSLGKPWTNTYERAADAAYFGIWQYRGTAEQNTKLASRMCPEEQVLGAGFSVATGYEKNLRVSMSATQNYVPVTSFALKDGTDLDIDNLGGKIFLTLEPGSTSREEIVMCTTQDTVGIDWETCTRGLAFSGTSTSAVVGLAKPHYAGSKVVMSNVHYVYEQFVDINAKDQTISGDKTYTGTTTFYNFPIVSSTSYTGLPSSNGQLATKYYVDTVGAGGFTASNVSTTRGLSVDGSSPEKVGINASSTTGGSFDASGKYYQAIGNALEYTGNAIAVSTSTIVSQIATTTPTAGMIPLANASSTLPNGWVTSITNNFVAGETIAAGDFVAIVGGNSATNTVGQPDGGGDKACAGGTWCGQTFLTTVNDLFVTSVSLYLKRGSTSNADSITISLRATDSSVKPTGSDIASVTVPRSTFTTSYAWYTFTFSSPVLVEAGNEVAIVLANPSGSGGALEIDWYTDSTSPVYTGGTSVDSADSGSTWTVRSGDDSMFTAKLLQLTGGRIYKTNTRWSSYLANNCVGVAQNSATAGQTIGVMNYGIDNNQTGLTPYNNYYLTNTYGAVSSTAGTVSRPVGVSLTATSMLLRLQNP